ncbi:MAG: tyrosine-type recombinase/integrase [Oscillospiraceae bacterium]
MARKKVERNISYDDVRKKYYVNLDFGIDPETGKQIKKSQTFDKLTQARAALRKHEAARDAGQTVLPKEITVTQWLNTWMNDVIKLSRATTTVYSYQKMIDNHITPAIGSVPLQKLTPTMLQQYYAAKIREGKISSNTVRKHHDLMNSAFQMAVKQGLLLSNPAAHVEAPATKRPDIKYYSLEQLQTLLKLSEGTRLEVLIKLAGLLGLRREEIMGLTWDCVDFEGKKIKITEVRTMAGNTVVTKDPKTSTSVRTLYMTEDIEDLLKREKEKQESYKQALGDGYQDSGYVFTHEDGRPVRPNYASDLFKKFIEDNDLPPLTLHGLRHSFASIANSKGIPMYDIGKALGHSSPSTTSEIYMHLMDQDHKGMLNKMWSKK